MLEPRRYASWRTRTSMRFLGGIADFDLWYRDDSETRVVHPDADVLPYLRVVGMNADMNTYTGNWDEFRLPLHLNEEVGSIGHPAERRLKGRWGDVQLTRDQVNEIEAYLRCFAPGVLGEPTNNKEEMK